VWGRGGGGGMLIGLCSRNEKPTRVSQKTTDIQFFSLWLLMLFLTPSLRCATDFPPGCMWRSIREMDGSEKPRARTYAFQFF